ncbi:hypothetical protein R50073_36480 [Maricurvus nonylphenolicus]
MSGDLPLTTETEKVIDSCTLCGKCNIQCYFQMEMAPGEVFAAKRKLFKERQKTETIQVWEIDDVLAGLLDIVGENWAFNDPTILTSYATFGSLSSQEITPAYVVLPKDAEETAAIVRLANQQGIPYLPISSGTNSSNIIKEKVILIDMGRMKTLIINEREAWAEVGAGIIAFDLQQAAMEKGLRFSIGESAAGVCANQVSTGIHSFFGYKKGMMADHYIEAELVSHEGEVLCTTSAEAPQITTRPKDFYQPSLPYICTRLKIKLYPVEEDEAVIFIPFRDRMDGLRVTREIAKEDLGTGMGLVGVEVLSEFLSISEEDSENFLDIAQYYLKINSCIMMMLNAKDLASLKQKFPDLTLIDRSAMQRVIQGIPAITGPESMALIEDVMDEDKPYDHIFGDMLEYFLKQIEITEDEVEELFEHIDNKPLRKALTRSYFDKEYSDPEYWFNYRMFSPRFLRTHWFFSVMYFTDTDNLGLIEEICEKNREFGELHDLKNAFCYVMPIDGGKRFFFEYEFFCDQRDEDMLKRLKKVFFLLANESRRMVKTEKGIYPVLNTLFNGLNKKDYYLYSNFDEET